MPRLTRSVKYAFLCLLLLAIQVGCSSSSKTSAPTGLSYPQTTISAMVGAAITANAPSVTGTVASYSVSPALPAGISLNTATGVISGTPTAAVSSTIYTITATNAGGSVTTAITIIVVPAVTPPSNLSYVQSNIVATVGMAITPNTPNVTGTVTSYSVVPALPAGLVIDSSSGAISGTPTTVTAFASYVVTGTNAGGSTATSLTISVVAPVAPSSLHYPQQSLKGLVGFAVTGVTPTFTGSSSNFSVSPALPSGLNLNGSTGAISGVPSVASSSPVFYTVTATNGAGSASTKIQIYIVSEAGPTAAYPTSLTINLAVGEPAPTLLPYGTAFGPTYTISPALPPGLVLAASSGAIYGTPTAVSPATTYTVTVTDPVGSSTVQVRLAVSKKLDSIIDTEGSGAVVTKMTSTRILTIDGAEHWVLWNATTGAKIVSGNRLPSTTQNTGWQDWPIDLKGDTVMIGIPNGVEIYSAIDGSLVGIFGSKYIDAPPGPYQGNNNLPYTVVLSADGRYVSGASFQGTEIYTRNGSWVTFVPGSTTVLPSASTCLVSIYDATNPIVLAVNPVTGESVTNTLSGASFVSFFQDGSHFFSRRGSVTWVNDLAGNRQILSLPTYSGLNGSGNIVWTFSSGVLTIYPVTSNVPLGMYNFSAAAQLEIMSSTLLAVTDAGTVSLIDLSGTAVARTDYATPAIKAVSAASALQWVGVSNGHLAEGPSFSTATPHFYSGAQIVALAASTNKVAVAMSDGVIRYFDSTTKAPLGIINALASDLAMSSDGTTLAVGTPSASLGSSGAIQIYSLLTNAQTGSIPYEQAPILSADGSLLGGLKAVYSSSSVTLTVGVAPSTGGSSQWSASGTAATLEMRQRISKDMTLAGLPGGTNAVSIYKNGVLLTAVPGVFLGWVDNSTLLVSSTVGNITSYSLYSTTGSLNGTVAFSSPVSSFVPIDSNRIYSTAGNTIYQLSTGTSAWAWGLPTFNQYGQNIPSWNNGAISGPYVVFINGYRVMRDMY